MATSAFCKGTEFTFKGSCYRMIREVSGGTWQIENNSTGRFQERSLTDLHKHYVSGELIILGKSGSPDTRRKDLKPTATVRFSQREPSPEEWEAAKLRRRYVLAIIKLPKTKAVQEPVINEIWQSLKKPDTVPSWRHVVRWLDKYVEADQNIYALIDRSRDRGNRSSRFPNEVVEIVDNVIDKIYLTLERKTIQDTLDHAIVEIQQENALRISCDQLPLPTRRLINRRIAEIPAFERYAARHGRTAANKAFRAVLHADIAKFPLHQAGIDHTRLDLFVIDDDYGLPLGRPWVTACLDSHTRSLLGIYVGFQPPSYLTVARCLKSAFLPKPGVRESFPEVKNEWHAYGLMDILHVDNGLEFHSRSLEDVCYRYGVEIVYSPRKSPWFKGHIERFFRSMHDGIAHGHPGTTFRNIVERDDYDPSKHAVITISALRMLIVKWVCDCYHQRPHRALDRATPAVFWSANIKPEAIRIPEDPAVLDAVLGRRESRVLTHKGIELEGLFYNSPDLVDLRRRLGDKLSVQLAVDDSDIGHITVFSPDQEMMYRVPALRLDYANGMSKWQHDICKRYAREQWQGHWDIHAWLHAKAEIAELVEKELRNKKSRSKARVARYQENLTKPEPAIAVDANTSDVKEGAKETVSAELYEGSQSSQQIVTTNYAEDPAQLINSWPKDLSSLSHILPTQEQEPAPLLPAAVPRRRFVAEFEERTSIHD